VISFLTIYQQHEHNGISCCCIAFATNISRDRAASMAPFMHAPFTSYRP